MKSVSFKNAKWVKEPMGGTKYIQAEIDSIVWDIPMDTENSTYVEAMRQVDAGELTIKDAE